MDRGAWKATFYGVTRVGHDLTTITPPIPLHRPHHHHHISPVTSQRSHLQILNIIMLGVRASTCGFWWRTHIFRLKQLWMGWGVGEEEKKHEVVSWKGTMSQLWTYSRIAVYVCQVTSVVSDSLRPYGL